VISITDGLGVFCYKTVGVSRGLTVGVSRGLIDLACALAAVGNRPAPFEDVESESGAGLPRAKNGAARREADAELRRSPAQCSREVGAELKAPTPAAFLGHQDAGFEHG
jgi:hypothetical protein